MLKFFKKQRITLEYCVKTYLESLEKTNLSQSAKNNIRYSLNKLQITLGPSMDINNLKFNEIEAYKGLLQDKELSPHTINKDLSFISSFLQYCINTENRQTPIPNIKKVYAGGLRENTYVDKRQFRFTLKKLKKELVMCKDNERPLIQDVYNSFIILFSTGMRIPELHDLKWGDVDFDKKSIFIRAYAKNKGGHRTIPVPDHLINFLSKIKEKRSSNSEYVISLRDLGHDKRQSSVKCGRFLKKMIQKYNFTFEITLKLLRRSFATMMLEQCSMSLVAVYLGHAKPDTTLKSYVNRNSVLESKNMKSLVEKISDAA